MREDEANRVAVPRSLLVAMILLVVGCLVAVGFLLGRQSGPAAGPTAAPPPAAAAPAPPSGPPDPAQPPVSVGAPEPASPAPEATPAPVEPPAPPPAASPPEAPATPAAAPVDPALRQEVADYFAAMDRSLAVAKQWDTADSVTQAAVLQATQGNPQQFQTILQANRQALAEIQAIQPPEPCLQHYQLAREVLQSAITLVGNVGAATMAGDMENLGDDLAPAARSLRDKVAQMRALRVEVCRAYGVPVPASPSS